MPNSGNILKSEKLDNLLRSKGYVTVPFLSAEEVGKLLFAFSEINTGQVRNFYASSHSADIALRKKYSEKINATIAESFSNYFSDCKLLGSSFVVKAPHYQESLQPHQDWNIVDEKKYRSFNIWIPLVDLNEQNGTILVMPESHRWLENYRHSSIPCAFREVYGSLWEHMVPLYLKAGEALIYDHALLHASFPNNSDDYRVACACGVVPSEAQMLFYRNGNGVIEEYESNPEFFMTENIFGSVNGLKKIREFSYDFPSVSENKFYQFTGIEVSKKKQEEITVGQSTEEKLPFWKVYTPLNVLREIKTRITNQ